MRIKTLILTICLANLAGGALLSLAIGQSSLGLGLGLALAGLAISGAGTVWCLCKFRRAFQVLADESTQSTTGLFECDQLADSFRESFARNAVEAEQPKKELEELRRFLEKVDRREFAMDRDGNPISSTVQLRGILRGYGGELEPVIQQVTSCGREIKRFTEQIVSGAEEQVTAVDRAATMIETMADAIVDVSENAESAVAASTTAKLVAQTGLQQFDELLEEMRQIRNHIAARERKLRTLGQHTQEIGNIVQTIGSLSSKTDMLALNASIESVRAGEHGRGFAVVAEEVRALSVQSAQAVVDITNRIELVQMETQQSISVAAGEHEKISDVIGKVDGTLERLRTISESSNTTADSVTIISNATKKQLELAHEIVTALEQNTVLSKGNRNQAEGAHWTAKTLGQLEGKLLGVLDLFRETGTFVAPRLPQEAPELTSPIEQPVG